MGCSVGAFGLGWLTLKSHPQNWKQYGYHYRKVHFFKPSVCNRLRFIAMGNFG